jgi:SAM-dependent methyltransferase
MVSALLIARSLLALGHVEAARQCLQESLGRLDAAEQPAAHELLTHLASPPETSNGQADAGNDKGAISAGAGPLASAIRYTRAKYQAYDNPARVDHLKKVLELAAVQQALADFPSMPDHSRMLDIGCATGRYLRWFATQGYQATGYDIEAAAVHIARQALADHPHIEIYQRDILQQAPELECYRVITSMMGTFNHIAPSKRATFLSWIYDSLQGGGRFVFSSWNPACRWKTYLQLYTPDEEALLRANSLSQASLHTLLVETGFGVRTLLPIGFVPGDHVPAWLDEADDAVIARLDEHLARTLPADQAQLFVVCAEKPGARPDLHG